MYRCHILPLTCLLQLVGPDLWIHICYLLPSLLAKLTCQPMQVKTILACGAEDTEAIIQALSGHADTVISILTFCTVPNPKETLYALLDKALKPGGVFIWSEHVRNPLPDVARWQRILSPIWSVFFDGCQLGRPTHEWIAAYDKWATVEDWVVSDKVMEDNMFWTRSGWSTKK